MNVKSVVKEKPKKTGRDRNMPWLSIKMLFPMFIKIQITQPTKVQNLLLFSSGDVCLRVKLRAFYQGSISRSQTQRIQTFQTCFYTNSSILYSHIHTLKK